MGKRRAFYCHFRGLFRASCENRKVRPAVYRGKLAVKSSRETQMQIHGGRMISAFPAARSEFFRARSRARTNFRVARELTWRPPWPVEPEGYYPPPPLLFLPGGRFVKAIFGTKARAINKTGERGRGKFRITARL